MVKPLPWKVCGRSASPLSTSREPTPEIGWYTAGMIRENPLDEKVMPPSRRSQLDG